MFAANVFPTTSVPGVARKPTTGPEALFLPPDGFRTFRISPPAFLLSGSNGVGRHLCLRQQDNWST